MAGWQYKAVVVSVHGGHIDPTLPEAELSHLGADQWELIAATPLCDANGETRSLLYTLRRPAEPKRRAGFDV